MTKAGRKIVENGSDFPDRFSTIRGPVHSAETGSPQRWIASPFTGAASPVSGYRCGSFFFAGTGDHAVAAADLQSARILSHKYFQPAGVRRDKKYQKNSLSPAFPFYIPPRFYEIGFRLNHDFCFSQNEKEEISKCWRNSYIQTYIHFYIQIQFLIKF